METFECQGWVHVTVAENQSRLHVKVSHVEDHVPYTYIDIPDDVRRRVESNVHMTVSQVRTFMRLVQCSRNLTAENSQLWTEILKMYPQPAFTRKAVHALWAQHHSKQWKLDENQRRSAEMLLDKGQTAGALGTYRIEPITLHSEAGFDALAFALPDMLLKFGGRIREISIDSACERTC